MTHEVNEVTNVRRTNIVIDKKRYPHWKKFADENYHGSLSQAIRSAMEDSILRSQNEGSPIALRPIVERLDEIEKQIVEVLNAVNQSGGQVDDLCSVNQVNSQRLLDGIQGILKEADHALLTEDVKEKLPEFTIHEVRRGLEILADKFVVERIEPSGESGNTAWKLLGG